MVYLTRRERFNAAHKLYRPDLTPEQNEALFGVCANDNWHGHNFDLFVTVKGKPSPETGFIIDLKQLGRLIKQYIVNKLDHRNLNTDIDFMLGIMPSTENLAMKIWEQLEPQLPEGCDLHCIKLYETENNFVEYYGE